MATRKTTGKLPTGKSGETDISATRELAGDGLRRREVLCAMLGLAAGRLGAADEVVQPAEWASLAGELGVTTGSFVRHLSEERQAGKLWLLDLPKLMRDELGMKVIDLMTATLPSLAPDYLKRLRDAAEDAGCVLTNLKMNQRGLDLGSSD